VSDILTFALDEALYLLFMAALAAPFVGFLLLLAWCALVELKPVGKVTRD
jgi:hypothetical protein